MSDLGTNMEIRQAEIRTDEGNHSWIASLALASKADWIKIKEGDPIAINLYGDVYNFRVTAKDMSRGDADTRQTYTVLAISPVAMLGAPYGPYVTRSWSGPVDARGVVEQLLGRSVTWSLPDWPIPADTLVAQLADPLAMARNVVAAVGGYLESAPDGTVICRSHFPLAVRQWATATPEQVITDAEMFSVSSQFMPVEVANRIIIADGDPGANDDAIEYIPDLGGERFSGQIRVYLDPWRNVSLLNSGSGDVAVNFLGTATIEQMEIVDFSQGKASVKYPIQSVNYTLWIGQNLGQVYTTQGMKQIAAATMGYSVLQISYTARCMVWQVSYQRNEDVEFLVSDS